MTPEPVVLTLGEPAGIGGEIALKAWLKQGKELPFFLLGDLGFTQKLGQELSVPVVAISDPSEAKSAMSRGLPVLNHPLPAPVIPGQPDAANAPEVVRMIERAVALVQSGACSALTTNPIHKKALHDGAGFAFPGHTEFLAHLGGAPRPVMMLSAPGLRVVPVTIHIPLKSVSDTLTPELLEQTLRITHAAMVQEFAIASPRIAVAGLNPHAGEGGAMGMEDADVIAPVIEKLQNEGMTLRGPLPADTMFHPPARAQYDVAVCMYHDQALIPIKTLDFANGVNTTLGLPFVRTSPDHGTAFDIAGQNCAEPSSLVAALRAAWEMACHRALM